MIANLLQEFAAPLSTEQANKVKEAIGDLSIDQVNWLSGYLSGLAATGTAVGLKDVGAVVGQTESLNASASAVKVRTSPEKQSKISTTILYASQTGNARGIAERLFQQFQQSQIESVLVDVADYNPKHLKKEQRILLITSTHGEGEPPDDAIELYEFVRGKKAPDLSHLEFAVLSLGDSSYEYFCQTGKELDASFEKLGAKRLFDRIDCDVDYLQPSKLWSEQVINQIQSTEDSEGAVKEFNDSSPHLRVVESEQTVFDKFNPYEASVTDVLRLSGRGSVKPTYHVELDLDGSDISYQPGDALGVWPVNQEALVEETLLVTGLDGNSLVQVDGVEKSLTDALKYDFELTQVSPQLVIWLAEKTQAADLLEIVEQRESLTSFLTQRQVPELLSEFPTSLDATGFVAQLRRMTPRLYSIASSQAEVDDEVHLTVGLVEEKRNGRVRFGAASQFLSQLTTESTVRVYVEQNKHFKLPDDHSKKIIMIGAGTGIAPFRGFIQERIAVDAKGESWLIFGNPHFATDFLYQLEWQQFLKRGALNKLDLAFSRDQPEKVYVQDKIAEQAAAIYQWIEEGAHIYVCGDKDRLGQSVEKALTNLLVEHGGLSEDNARLRLKEMRKNGRYQKDVY